MNEKELKLYRKKKLKKFNTSLKNHKPGSKQHKSLTTRRNNYKKKHNLQ